jgi:large subunit ribosomal protein L25
MITLKAEKRDQYGKALAKARQEGRLPVVIYGRKEVSTPYFVNTRDFKKVLSQAGESTVISFSTPEGDKDVLIYQVDNHPVSGEPLHVDLYAVEKGKPVQVAVELIFEGVPPAVKELGGNLVKVLYELEIEALPKDLPHEIKVDVSVLTALDGQILIKDLKLPAGVTAVADGDEVVASISQGGEEVKEEEAPVDLEAIEVEKKGKKEDEEGGATDEEAA